VNFLFAKWRKDAAAALKLLRPGFHPKEISAKLSGHLLYDYAGKSPIDQYDVYQHLIDCRAGTMQDDCYLIAADGWKAEPTPLSGRNGKGRKEKGRTCGLVTKPFIVARYFAAERAAIATIEAELGQRRQGNTCTTCGELPPHNPLHLMTASCSSLDAARTRPPVCGWQTSG